MRTPTLHADLTKKAIGYIRVSTLEQASEGVSLDAQRDKLRAYCLLNEIKLVEIVSDEGVSGSTMERPGLQSALRMIQRGRANTLIVVKLDRLTRSVRDLCLLVDDYFTDDRHHLLSVCGMINTNSAVGRMLMLNLANFAQFEREIIAERTREALQHIKAQGIKLGNAPYGYTYSRQLDEKGRRVLVPLESEQAVIRKIADWHAGGMPLHVIAEKLTADGIPARRGGMWHTRMVSVVLQRDGKRAPRPYKRSPQIPLICDKAESAMRARELRADGLSLRQIGLKLREEGYVPARGGAWHASTVRELLSYRAEPDRASAAQRARELRAQGQSLNEIGVRLMQEGHLPPRGGRWHASMIAKLLPV